MKEPMTLEQFVREHPNDADHAIAQCDLRPCCRTCAPVSRFPGRDGIRCTCEAVRPRVEVL